MADRDTSDYEPEEGVLRPHEAPNDLDRRADAGLPGFDPRNSLTQTREVELAEVTVGEGAGTTVMVGVPSTLADSNGKTEEVQPAAGAAAAPHAADATTGLRARHPHLPGLPGAPKALMAPVNVVADAAVGLGRGAVHVGMGAVNVGKEAVQVLAQNDLLRFAYASAAGAAPVLTKWKWWKHLPRFTILEWLGKYHKIGMPWKQKLISDFSAAIVMVVMLIPQGLGYSLLAGMPPVYGLYSAFIPLFFYPLFSTSPQLSIGPTAMASMVSYSAASPYVDPHVNLQHFVTVTFMITFLAGLIQISMGLLHMGFLVKLLSRPLLTGFLCASAIVIMTSQLGLCFGFHLIRSDSTVVMYEDFFQKLPHTNLITLALAAENVFLLMGLQWVRNKVSARPSVKSRPMLITLLKALPIQLLVVVLNIVLVTAFELDKNYGVEIMGHMPRGLPTFVNIFAGIRLGDVVDLVPGAGVVAILGFVECISIAKSMKYRFPDNPNVESDQELYAIGAANVGGSLFGCFPGSTALARSAVNADVGAQSQLGSYITGGMMIFVLLYITPVFERLPSVTLACIIITAVIKLVDLSPLRSLWKLSKEDWIVYVVAFAATLLMGMTIGLALAMMVAIASVMQRLIFPYWSLLGRMPNSNEFRSMHRDPDAMPIFRMCVVQFDARLFFANAEAFEETIVGLSQSTQHNVHLRYVIVDCSTVSRIDATGLHVLLTLPTQMRPGTELVLCNAREIFADILNLAAKVDKTAKDHKVILKYLNQPLHIAVDELTAEINAEEAAANPDFVAPTLTEADRAAPKLASAFAKSQWTFDDEVNQFASASGDAAEVSSLLPHSALHSTDGAAKAVEAAQHPTAEV